MVDIDISKHVKAKPLEWLQLSDTSWCATTIFEPYFVRRLGEEWVWKLYGYPISESATKTLKEAQDAVQSDYESRILSALEPSPTFEAMVEALEEAQRVLLTVQAVPHATKAAALVNSTLALARGERSRHTIVTTREVTPSAPPRRDHRAEPSDELQCGSPALPS